MDIANYYPQLLTDQLNNAHVILIVILLIVLILLLIYLFTVFRKLKIIFSKVDYLVEDVTYKLELMNSTVETIVKISNYVDTFEAITKRNVKAMARLAIRNRDFAYKLFDKLKDFANKDNADNMAKKTNKKTPPQNKKTTAKKTNVKPNLSKKGSK